MARLDIKLPLKLQPVFDGPARYRGAYGGRGGAKSVAFANMAIATIINEPMRFLCTRELQKSLKDSVFSLLQSQIFKLGANEAFNIGKEYIRCKNGPESEFLFYGLRSNIAEIKGLHGVKRSWIEEAQSTSKSSLDYLLPTIREPNSEVWATWNPDDEDDPIHQLLVRDEPYNAKVAKINWYDNPWFPDVLNEERLRTQAKDPARYEWMWGGNFNINTDGSVYGKWIHDAQESGRIRSGLFDPALPVHTAWDIGYSDYTAIWFFQTINGELRVIDYYENNRHGLQHYCEQLSGYMFVVDGQLPDGRAIYKRGDKIDGLDVRRRYRYANHWVPHDAAHKLFASGGRSIVEQAYDFGFPMKVMPALPQQSQIQIARKSLESTWFDAELCREGVKMLRKYQFEYDDDKKRYADKPLHDYTSHAADAYELLAQVWKSPIMEGNKPEPRFFEDLSSSEIFWPKPGRGGRERI